MKAVLKRGEWEGGKTLMRGPWDIATAKTCRSKGSSNKLVSGRLRQEK